MKYFAVTLVALSLLGCKEKPPKVEPIRYDGSSTVYPVVRSLADRFPNGKVDGGFLISAGGTGAGINKLCRGEVDIAGASRPIRADERQKCQTAQVGILEVPIAFDGIAVVVHPENDWVDQLTTEELAKIWSADATGKVKTWADVREGWPKKPLKLYGPGLDSGTYDYFNKAILGAGTSRDDYDSSEDDNLIARSVATEPNALGYFSLAYARGADAKLKTIPIDDGDDSNGVGSIAPTTDTIRKETYQPLSRPIFIYVSATSAERAEVSAFVDFILDGAPAIAEESGFAPLPPKAYSLAKSRFESRLTGTAFPDGAQVGVKIEDLLR